jgi:hypothetical protein
MLKQVQSNTFSGMQQGAQKAVKLSYENYMNSDNGRDYPMSESEYMNMLHDFSGFRGPIIPNTIPNVTDMNSAIKAQKIQNFANEQTQEMQFADTHFGLTPTDWQAYIQANGQPPTSQQDVDQWRQSSYSVGG